MLAIATFVFLYYTVWTLLMVRPGDARSRQPRDTFSFPRACNQQLTRDTQPFVDEDHILHTAFPPRVWAIRIPVILILLGSAVVGSFLGVVMIRSNRKKAAKAKAVKAK